MNLADKSFLGELNRLAITLNLNSRDPMELSHVSDFEFCIETQNTSIY
jgi:hypothetical protein